MAGSQCVFNIVIRLREGGGALIKQNEGYGGRYCEPNFIG